jgi:hypothetical protein
MPVLVPLLRLPGLNFMSHNRLVFATSFAILALGVTGLNVLWSGNFVWSRWYLLPGALLASFGLWCLFRSAYLPESVTIRLDTLALQAGKPTADTMQKNRTIRDNFGNAYLAAALLSAAGVAIWIAILRIRGTLRALCAPLLGAGLVVNLVWFAYGVNTQCDPVLFFPRMRIFTELLEQHQPGRVLGIRCLPPNLNMMYGFYDIRGYDAVDPRPLVEVLVLAQDPKWSSGFAYAITQYFTPRLYKSRSPGQLKVSPVLSMLNVRYLLFHGMTDPSWKPLLSQGKWSVLENPDALPRIFVPRQVTSVPAGEPTLRRLAQVGYDLRMYAVSVLALQNSPLASGPFLAASVLFSGSPFDPRRTALVEDKLDLPEDCAGDGEIIEDKPTRVVIRAQMRTPGLLVLADRWDEGWRAWRNGEPVRILRTNHLLRGVELPEGLNMVEFRYQPASLSFGVRLMAGGLAVLLSWCAGLLAWSRLRRRSADLPATSS